MYTIALSLIMSIFAIVIYRQHLSNKKLAKKISDLEIKNSEIMIYMENRINSTRGVSKEEFEREITMVKSQVESGMMALSKRIGKREAPAS
jgi:predicted DNA-binding transcriptional regulator